MTPKSYLVTGGTGFLGSALAGRLIRQGHRIRILDNDSRGKVSRLDSLAGQFEFVAGDIRDPDAVRRAVVGVDSVIHLAFINGTEFFYSQPALVLDVGVRGMLNVVDACLAENVGELVLASSSEVYQAPPTIPTPEAVPLVVPDPFNPRYSYAGGKIISELLAINYGRDRFERVLIFRPHNVYGPDMGWEHVIPQFILRMARLCADEPGIIRFPVQGTGDETRAFVYVDDFIDGVVQILERGSHLNVYHVGSREESRIADLAQMLGEYFGREVEVIAGPGAAGSVQRRCPDISKLARLGYQPQVTLREGLARTADWYVANAALAPAK